MFFESPEPVGPAIAAPSRVAAGLRPVTVGCAVEKTCSRSRDLRVFYLLLAPSLRLCFRHEESVTEASGGRA